jgi:hypothetical protein
MEMIEDVWSCLRSRHSFRVETRSFDDAERKSFYSVQAF